jgi:hypothetical protein
MNNLIFQYEIAVKIGNDDPATGLELANWFEQKLRMAVQQALTGSAPKPG